MVRPKSLELTDRELVVMQVFWLVDEATADTVREQLDDEGVKLAYTTVANVVRGLLKKKFLEQTHRERPFRYRAAKTFDDVSDRLVGDFLQRLFQGSRQSMLLHVLRRKKLTEEERKLLLQVLAEGENDV